MMEITFANNAQITKKYLVMVLEKSNISSTGDHEYLHIVIDGDPIHLKTCTVLFASIRPSHMLR